MSSKVDFVRGWRAPDAFRRQLPEAGVIRAVERFAEQHAFGGNQKK